MLNVRKAVVGIHTQLETWVLFGKEVGHVGDQRRHESLGVVPVINSVLERDV